MIIESPDQLGGILGNPHPALEKKIYKYLNPRMQRFIEHAPLLFMSTVDEDGFPTISPKGDHPGFVKVENNTSLVIPERKGNKLAYSFRNILSGSKVALLFIVPGTNEVLRVHGEAVLICDQELNKQLNSRNQDALMATRVSVVSSYFHCGKALLRSGLFSGETEYRDMDISFGREMSENNAFDAAEAVEFDIGVKSRYKTDL